jgi:hypothetical protein
VRNHSRRCAYDNGTMPGTSRREQLQGIQRSGPARCSRVNPGDETTSSDHVDGVQLCELDG